MKITEVALPTPQHPCPEPRSPGLHVGDVIRYMLVRGMGQQDYDAVERSAADTLARDEVRFVGFMFELGGVPGLRRQLGWGLVDTQVELHKDGLYGTLDGLCLDDDWLEEYKTTSKSGEKFNDVEAEWPGWIIQMKAYCYMAGLSRCRLLAYLVNESYSYQRKVKPEGFMLRRFRLKLIEFEPAELERNWSAMMRAKESLLTEIERGSWRLVREERP